MPIPDTCGVDDSFPADLAVMIERFTRLKEVWELEHAAAIRVDPEVVPRAPFERALDSEIVLVGQALGRDTQRLSGFPYVFPGGPPYRLSSGGLVLDRWLETVGYSIRPDEFARRYAYHSDLHPGFPGRSTAGVGDVPPSAGEIEAGAEWLRRVIEVIAPRAIICLGLEPAREILRRYGRQRVKRLGDITERQWPIALSNSQIQAFVAYHPSGAYMHPARSEQAWAFIATHLLPSFDASGRFAPP